MYMYTSKSTKRAILGVSGKPPKTRRQRTNDNKVSNEHLAVWSKNPCRLGKTLLLTRQSHAHSRSRRNPVRAHCSTIHLASRSYTPWIGSATTKLPVVDIPYLVFGRSHSSTRRSSLSLSLSPIHDTIETSWRR